MLINILNTNIAQMQHSTVVVKGLEFKIPVTVFGKIRCDLLLSMTEQLVCYEV